MKARRTPGLLKREDVLPWKCDEEQLILEERQIISKTDRLLGVRGVERHSGVARNELSHGCDHYSL